MDLKHEVKTLLGREEHAGNPLADYLAGCLNAYEPNSWAQAVAIRAAITAECDARYPPAR